MTSLTHGLINYVVRSSVQNRAGLSRAYRVNDVILPTGKYPIRGSPVTVISRQFSLDSLPRYPMVIFRYVAESEVTVFARNFFTSVHDFTGLPWWLSIAASATVLKIISAPLRVYQIELLGHLNVVKKELAEVAKRVKLETLAKQRVHMWTPEKARRLFNREMKKEKKIRIEKYNCHPGKVIILSYFELPVWIVMSITLRTMSYGFSDDVASSNILTSQMLVEGPFWCTNLSVPDRFYITPIMLALCHFALIEFGVVHNNLLKQKQTKFYKILTNASRVFGVLAAVISSFLPASVSLFWLSSTFATLVRDLLLVSQRVRRILKLPYEPVSYGDVYGAFKNKFFWISKLKWRKGRGPQKD